MRIGLNITLALLPTATFADEPVTSIPLSYEAFEVSVVHMDLDSCPDKLAGPDRFCRATLASDQLHVFVFSESGDSPLIGFASYDTGKLAGLLN